MEIVAKFIKSSSEIENYYKHNNFEICFIGRSNVGKSSLLNAIVGTKIARVSKTPGRTKLINFFEFNKIIMVDLPGYGYAKTSIKESKKMDQMVQEYFLNRKKLKMVFLLIDSKIGFMKIDLLMINFLTNENLPYCIIGTKIDKANQLEKTRFMNDLKLFDVDYFLTSSQKNIQIQELRKFILNIQNLCK